MSLNHRRAYGILFAALVAPVILSAIGAEVCNHEHNEVCATGQAALIQKATSIRSSVRVLPKTSSIASVDSRTSLLQFADIMPPSDGLQKLVEAEVAKQLAHLTGQKRKANVKAKKILAQYRPSNEKVWDNLEDMSLKDVQQATFEAPTELKEAAAQSQAPSKPVCGVLWFYHIGKCAGTSGYSWLRQMKELGGLQEVLDLSATPSRWGVDFEGFDKSLYQSIDRNAGKVIAVHHHHNAPGLYGWMQEYFERLQGNLNAKGCKLVRWTLLRKPEPRLISHVNFVMQLKGLQNLDKAAHDNFFRSTLAASDATKGDDQFVNQYDNHEIRYLLNNFGRTGLFPMHFGGPHEDALKAAFQILDKFEVVGTTEKVDDSVAKVRQLLGLPALPFPTTNVRKAQYHAHDAQPLPDDVQLLVQERTAYEKKLWDRYAAGV